MRISKEILSIAALLHDIGKLGWRAGEKGTHQEIGAKFLQMLSEDLPSEVSSLVSMHHDDSQEDLFNQEGYITLKQSRRIYHVKINYYSRLARIHGTYW